MTLEKIDFPSVFSKEQLQFITNTIVIESKNIFGASLCDVMLYGSYARGDFHEWSDVDIIIIADENEQTCKKLHRYLRERLWNLIHHMNLLLSIIVVPYSRFVYLCDDYPFYANVRKDGISLCSHSSK
jgi:predicted nucleotidyltransferase